MKYQRPVFFTMILMFNLEYAHCQLHVNSSGNVGIKTASPSGAFHVEGDVYLTDNGNILRILPDNGSSPEIGSNTDEVVFWYSGNGHNDIHCQSVYTFSDSTGKESIEPLESGLDMVLKMSPRKYNLRQSEDPEARLAYGFISQEMELILPSIVAESKGHKLMEYDQILPFLVAAIQEMSIKIDSLDSLVTLTQGPIYLKNQAETQLLYSGTVSFLAQNSPNPFRESTVLRFGVAEDAEKASIMIFDLQGTLIKTYPIKETGLGEIIIQGRELKAGMYIYSLVVDGVESDSKKMILSK